MAKKSFLNFAFSVVAPRALPRYREYEFIYLNGTDLVTRILSGFH